MTTHDRIRETIFNVFDEVNEQLPRDRKLVKADSTALVGSEGALDSLGLVNFIVALEQKLESNFQVSVSLIDEDLVSDGSRFASVASLTDYLASILPVSAD